MRDSTQDMDRLARLLDAEKGVVPPAPPGARERVMLRVEQTLGGPAVAPVAPLNLAPAGVARSLPAAGRWGLAVVLAVAASAGVYLALRPSGPAPAPIAAPAVVPAPAPRSAVEAAGTRPPAAAPPTLVVQPGSAAAPRAAGPAAPAHSRHVRDRIALDSEGDLAAERALLEDARTALAVGDTRRALATTRQHERRFASGQLVEERESIAIRALVVAGHTEAARRRADALQRRFPGSMFLPAVEAVLQHGSL